MKKKLLAALLMLTISVFSLISCGKNTDSSQESVTETQENSEGVTEATETITSQVTESVDGTEVESSQETTEDTQTQEATQAQNESQDTSAEASQEQKTENVQGQESQNKAYTYEDMSATMYAKSSVNVRDLPCQDGKQLGKLAKYEAATVTGKCKETGWYRIKYNNGTAYVSGNYLITEAEKVAAEQKAKEAEAKKSQESAQKQEQTNKSEQTADTKKEESSASSSSNSDSSESQKKNPEWIMMESASNKYLTQEQKEHIDGMVKKWINGAYTDSQLDAALMEYLQSIGINIGFGEPEPTVTSSAIGKVDNVVLSKKQQGNLEKYEQIVRNDAGIYSFNAFYTEWKYNADGELYVWDYHVGIS